MEKILVNTSTARSEILIGEKWENVGKYLPSKNIVIITDENVFHYYGKNFPPFPVFTITSGEEYKSLKTIEQLASTLLENGIDRSGFILAVGGGVISDVAGFLAAIYMRGIRCGYISTTLLSQVDASTGGKNGVNFGGIKNILGVIRQPEFVICDPEMLATLPEPEFLSGLAELIKTAIIGDSELFELIENHYSEILRRDTGLLTTLIAKSIRFKAAVVSEDENETGVRRILNFGHTFGHAIEILMSFKHGMAVASGMKLAAHFSHEKGFIGQEERDRIIHVINKYHFNETIDIPFQKMEQLIMYDKKKSGTGINFVFTRGIGKASYENIPATEIINFYKRFREKNN